VGKDRLCNLFFLIEYKIKKDKKKREKGKKEDGNEGINDWKGRH
jgi:hypothetical protein